LFLRVEDEEVGVAVLFDGEEDEVTLARGGERRGGVFDLDLDEGWFGRWWSFGGLGAGCEKEAEGEEEDAAQTTGGMVKNT
jgi:hypothetical protein